MPIQVYLDSSDFSLFADPRTRENPQVKSALQSLRTQVQDGTIEVRCSSVHVAEALHLKLSYKNHAIERARIIESLAREKALIHPFDLFILEGIALATSNSLDIKKVQKDDGSWFPHSDSHAKTMVGEVRRIFEETIREQLHSTQRSRVERRLVERQLVRNGKLTRLAIETFLKKETPLLQLESMFPVSKQFYEGNYLRRMITGEISELEFWNELMKGVTSIEKLVGWYVDRYDQEKITAGWIRNLGTELAGATGLLKSRVATIIASHSNATSSKQFLRALEKDLQEQRYIVRSNLISRLGLSEKDRLKKCRVSAKDWKTKVLCSELGSLPGLDLFIGATIEWAMLHTKQYGASSGLTDSDVVDFIHASYLPYVDVFRCDKRAEPILRKVAGGFTTRIVKSMEELIEVVVDVSTEKRSVSSALAKI